MARDRPRCRPLWASVRRALTDHKQRRNFEVRSAGPDATRAFHGKLFGWTFPDGGIPGYSYVETGVEGAVPGGISPLQDGEPLVTFFAGVEDAAAVW